MATSADAVLSGRAHARDGYPAASLRFDWVVAFLSTIFVVGIFIDGWAHNHNQVDNTFFTPWHAMLYSGFGIVGAFLTATMGWNFARGYSIRRALPRGYAWSMVGVIVFAAGGVGDLIWHTLFGIEASVDALLSPTHLILALGVILIATGPLRAAWLRFSPESTQGWISFGPMIISATLFLAMLMFFTQYAHPFVDTLASNYRDTALGVISILLQSGILMSVILFLIKRWTLPFGAMTLIVAATSLMVSIFHDHYELLPGALIAGLLADALSWRLKPSAKQAGRYYLFAFAVPALFYACYFITLNATQGIDWTVHMWAGAIVQAGVVGLLVSFLLLPPFRVVLPDDSSHT